MPTLSPDPCQARYETVTQYFGSAMLVVFEGVRLLLDPGIGRSCTHAPGGLGSPGQVLHRVGEIQDTDDIRAVHVQERLLPVGAVHHSTHGLGCCDAGSMQFDPRLT